MEQRQRQPRALASAPAAATTKISSTVNTTRGHSSSSAKSKSDGVSLSTIATPAKQQRTSAADLFTLSPIAEAESFSLKMPESPAPPTAPHHHHRQQYAAHEHAPMEVDSTTPSRTAHYAPQQQEHRHGHHHTHQHQQQQPSDAKRPLLSVFDWDDTLCPSWWLYRKGLLASHGLVHEPAPSRLSAKPRGPGFHFSTQLCHHPSAAAAVATSNTLPLSDRERQRFTQLEDHVLSLLQLAMQMGPVFIITAATLPWVEACARHFLPRVQLLLKQHADKVHVVSAREWYQQHVRREGDPLAWKSATFDALCAHLQLEKVSRRLQHRVDFVSIGDSIFERDACRQMERKAPAIVHSKTLKFVDRPSVQELLDQVALTSAIYERIRSHGGSLDLHITRRSQRQKGDPTLKLVQVDFSNQQSHEELPLAHGGRARGFEMEPRGGRVHSKMPSYHAREAHARILTTL